MSWRRGAAALLGSAVAALAAPAPYVGEPVKTAATGQEVYMMFSAYKIVPYSAGYVENVLAAFGRTGITGVIYSSVGGVSGHLEGRWPKEAGPAPDEVAYNTGIYEQARELGAKLWLQVPEYYNRVAVDGAPRLVTAHDILNDTKVREAFRNELVREVKAYSDFAGKDARVIVFEEAGIYHSPQGGGIFWATPEPVPATTRTRPNAFYDGLFADNMKRVFSHIHGWVREVNPDAQVGMHLGHQAVEDGKGLKKAVAWLEGRGARPDFIFYDLYLGAQSPRGDRWENYRAKLTTRRANIAALDTERPIPALHLGQLHTMNNFQNGRGYTPTREELDKTVALDGAEELNFEGVGYYTKNALPTDPEVSPNAYEPNVKGATTAAESSTDRWDYGLTQLFERRGVDYREWFDLVLYGRFQKDSYRVHAKRVDTGEWQLIGRVDRSLRDNYRGDEAVVLRFLQAKEFLGEGQTTLTLKIEATPGFAGGQLVEAYVLPSQPAKGFRSSAQVKEEIQSGAITRQARGGGIQQVALGTQGAEVVLTTAER